MTSIRSIPDYIAYTRPQLHEVLVVVVQELCENIDQLGFLRTQELEAKREVWTADPTASIQTRDRTATYAASHITTQILTTEATIDRLRQERMLVERLIDGA